MTDVTGSFLSRHLGPRPDEVADMLARIGVSTLDQLIEETVPANIRLPRPLRLPRRVPSSPLGLRQGLSGGGLPHFVVGILRSEFLKFCQTGRLGGSRCG